MHNGSNISDANWNQAGGLATRHVRSAINGVANPFGVYNLSGNSWEWIADNCVSPYDTSSATAPLIEVSGSTLRSWRGGSWNYHEATLQTALSFSDEENRGHDHFGFRIAGTHSTSSANKFMKTSFNVYPNPAKEQLTISMVNRYIQTAIHNYTITGQLIKSHWVHANSETIKLDNLSKGLYLIKLGEMVKKLIIE